jgi:uncharacterized protein (TIGR00251 family)
MLDAWCFRMIDLTDHAEGVILPVRAQAGARKSGLRGEQNGALKVAVTQIAEKGKANDALIDALAKGLSLKRSQIELIAGHTQPQKKFLIRGLTRAEFSVRLSAALGKKEQKEAK